MISLEVPLPIEFLEAKASEIDFLARKYGIKASKKSIAKWTYVDLFEFQFKVREKSHKQQEGYLGESYFPGQELLDRGGFALDYSYQRVRLNILNNKPLSLIYAAQNEKFIYQKLHLVSSAQAAMTQLFAAIESVYGKIQIDLPFDSYHETKRFWTLNHWRVNRKKKFGEGVLFLDSSTLPVEIDFKSLLVRRKYKLIVFDSTCFGRQSSIMQSWIKWLSQTQIPLILVRSAVKLDCLGLEWGRFGNVLFLDKKIRGPFSKLQKMYDLLTGQFGTSASTRQIFPFYDDRNFLRFNLNWLERIRNANQLTVELLRAHSQIDSDRIIEFSHANFFWIRLPSKQSLSQKWERQFCQRLLVAKVPYVVASSFPWSAVALTSFYDRSNYELDVKPLPHDARYLRVSMGDFDKKTAIKYAQLIAIALRENLRS